VLVYAEAMRTWLDDDAPDLARTMAALDRALRRGERAMQMVSNLCCLLPRFADRARRDRDTGRAAA
ncbi:MAG: TetR/AcrR family transcriptional regulator, partial [Bauldia sp.]